MADAANGKKTKRARQYLIVALMTKESVDRVISVLVKRGYTVAPLASTKKAYTHVDGNLVTTLGLDITGDVPIELDDDKIRTHISEDVKDVLKVTQTKYYMMWLGDPGHMFSWSLGNITQEVVEATAKVIPFKSPGNLN